MRARSRFIPSSQFFAAPLGVLLVIAGFAQDIGNHSTDAPAVLGHDRDQATEALNRVHQGAFYPADVELIVTKKAQQAIPDLKKQFSLTQDQTLKTSVASALMRLADPDPAWWDYLVQAATDAVTSDAPPQAKFDWEGKLIPGPTSEFLAWAEAHNLTPEAAVELVTFELPAKVTFLGKTGDRRAIPLLRRALSSQNFMIQASAAHALADLHDKESIPQIIQVCQQAPAQVALLIAGSLLRFDDEQAQSAAKLFRPISGKNTK